MFGQRTLDVLRAGFTARYLHQTASHTHPPAPIRSVAAVVGGEMVQPTLKVCLVRGADLAALLPRDIRSAIRNMHTYVCPLDAMRPLDNAVRHSEEAKTAGGAVMHTTTVTAAAPRSHPRTLLLLSGTWPSSPRRTSRVCPVYLSHHVNTILELRTVHPTVEEPRTALCLFVFHSSYPAFIPTPATLPAPYPRITTE